MSWRGAGLALGLGAALTACDSGGLTAIPEAEQTVNPSAISRGSALATSRVAQANMPDTVVAQGAGESMQPLVGDNTLFLIAPIDWDDLQPGMQVAYKDPFGRQIIHILLEKQADGWLVKGYNNQRPDRYRVTRENLVGVVYGTVFANQPFEKPE
jgi:hypothetical protein